MLYLPALIVAAVLMTCAAVVLVVSEKAEATFPGKNGRVAYASYDGNDYEIYTINPNGSGKTKVTNNVTNDVDPSYSPDGKKIVYAGQDGPEGDYEIYTNSARGGDKFQVTHNFTYDLSPSYSPSGEKIAYVGSGVGGGGIYTINASGGGKSKVTEGGAPSYSPSGKKLAYECYAGIDTDICTISVRGGGKFNVTNNDTDDSNPDYSPDGNRIAYEGFEGRAGENQFDDASVNIYTINVGGGGKFNVTKSNKIGSRRNQWPSYSPDGNRIAYQGSDREIHTIKVGGGGKYRVTNNDTADYGVSWGSRP